MEHIRPQSGGHVAPPGQPHHETSDVNVKAILGFGVFLIISGILVHVMLYGMYKLLDRWADSRNPPPNPMMVAAQPPRDGNTMSAETEKQTATRLNRTFGGNALNPMLQVDDVRDMDLMRKAQNAQIDQYQWANKTTGSVRIPIDRAMDLIVERGLPVVPMLPPGKAAANAGAAPGANAPVPAAPAVQK